jgi:hypothetical protein
VAGGALIFLDRGEEQTAVPTPADNTRLLALDDIQSYTGNMVSFPPLIPLWACLRRVFSLFSLIGGVTVSKLV